MRGHSLKHGCGGLLVRDAFRNFYQTVCRDRGIFGVTSSDAGVSHAVANFERLHVTANCADSARSFLSVDERKRGRVAAFTEINVDEIYAGRGDLDHSFIGLGCGNGYINEGENFRTAGLLYLNRFHSSPG